MDRTHRLFSLQPRNHIAEELLSCYRNKDLVSPFMVETVLDIGHFKSNATRENKGCIATLGSHPSADIGVPENWTTLSELKCEFLVVKDTYIKFVDKSRVVSCREWRGENGDRNFLSGNFRWAYNNDRLCRIELKINQSDWAEFAIVWYHKGSLALPLQARRNALLPLRQPAMADTQVLPATDPKPESLLLPPYAANTWPTDVSRYEYSSRPLGRGNFGTVYRVKDRKKNRFNAVKVQHDSDEVKREIEILKSLKGNSTNIVQFHRNIIHQETMHIFMDLMDGSLHDMVEQKAWPVQLTIDDLAIKVYHQVLKGLDYIHSKGFIHRDLKPANILWTLKGDELNFCIADFGLCIEQSLAKNACGSPMFIAPELRFHGPQTTAVDLWSLFITYLWTANLEDCRKEKWKNYEDLLVWIASLATRRWNDLAVVRELIVLDPKDRATASQMLKHKFEGDRLKTEHKKASDLPTVMAPEIKNPRTGVKWLHQLVRPRGVPALEPIHEMAPGNHIFTRLVLWSVDKEENVRVVDEHGQSGGGGRIIVGLKGKAFKNCPKSPVAGRVTKQKAAVRKRLVIRGADVRGIRFQAKGPPAAGACFGRLQQTPGLFPSLERC